MSGLGFAQRAVVFGLLIWAICSQPVSAGTHVLYADVSVGVKFDSDSTFTPGMPCKITNPPTDSQTDYMLIRFDFAGWQNDTIVSSARLRLTRSGGQNPSPYIVYAYGLCTDNTDWYLAPQNATGLWQYYDTGGDSNIPWKNSSGQPDTIENADYWLGGSGSTWDGETLEISLNAVKVQNWITGTTPNNGMRLESNKTSAPYFYGSGAANVTDRPTLIIEADAPEPTSLVILGVGSFGVLFRRRLYCRCRYPVKISRQTLPKCRKNLQERVRHDERNYSAQTPDDRNEFPFA